MQRVNAHIEDVAPFVFEADGLLLLAPDIDLLEATKLTDAVVNVDHKIARLQAHQFLDGQCLFVLFKAVFEAEPVVALKNLMVRVNGQLESDIHKALAQFSGNGGVFNLIAPIGKNVVQTLQLCALSRHHKRGKSILVAVLQMLCQQVKVLVESRLVLLPKVDHGAVGKAPRSAKLHDTVNGQPALKPQPCGVHLTGPQRIRLAGPAVIKRLGLVDFFVELVHHTAHIPSPYCAAFAQEVQEGLPLFLEHLIPHIRYDDRAVHLANAQLIGRVEFADAVHLVTKELNPIRMVKGKTEYVHNASSDGILTGLIDVVDFFETVVNQDVV